MITAENFYVQTETGFQLNSGPFTPLEGQAACAFLEEVIREWAIKVPLFGRQRIRAENQIARSEDKILGEYEWYFVIPHAELENEPRPLCPLTKIFGSREVFLSLPFLQKVTRGYRFWFDKLIAFAEGGLDQLELEHDRLASQERRVQDEEHIEELVGLVPISDDLRRHLLMILEERRFDCNRSPIDSLVIVDPHCAVIQGVKQQYFNGLPIFMYRWVEVYLHTETKQETWRCRELDEDGIMNHSVIHNKATRGRRVFEVEIFQGEEVVRNCEFVFDLGY